MKTSIESWALSRWRWVGILIANLGDGSAPKFLPLLHKIERGEIQHFAVGIRLIAASVISRLVFNTFLKLTIKIALLFVIVNPVIGLYHLVEGL